MKKLLIGAVAGAAITLVVYKLAKDGKLDGLCENASDFAGKAKRKIKDQTDLAINKAEYYTDRTGRRMKVAKRSLDRKFDELSDIVGEKLANRRAEAEEA
ncbi:hypothetical protein M2132_002083 [Dysgonomonas sp. PH5-45]|uniref:hypothetical protein n=1 Tax=unclassified Dysgonomonas TaxID=2630389 RepID=UPI0024772874|nr:MULTISPECIES: hypothetical protein [unclassified Dysgonomonas]MDH6355737.1 hypothetical protein [Dysgonomonas sp. PH5-45]MDH6388634.1 hypothetical protein [Dysgonomonas sp. PH5-37]